MRRQARFKKNRPRTRQDEEPVDRYDEFQSQQPLTRYASIDRKKTRVAVDKIELSALEARYYKLLTTARDDPPRIFIVSGGDISQSKFDKLTTKCGTLKEENLKLKQEIKELKRAKHTPDPAPPPYSAHAPPGGIFVDG